MTPGSYLCGARCQQVWAADRGDPLRGRYIWITRKRRPAAAYASRSGFPLP
jgi:hypothetical protein